MKQQYKIISIGLFAVLAFSLTSWADQSLALPGIHLTAVDGNIVALGSAASRPSALVFLSTDCPICRWYIAQLNDMAADAKNHGVDLMGVISDPTVTRSAAAKFCTDYQVHFPIVFDASGELAAGLNPRVTPEAFVLNRLGEIKYRGRIDDAYTAPTKQAQHVDHHDLAAAITAIAVGKLVTFSETTPIGCVFEAWKNQPATKTSVNFTRDVAPIVSANCVACHHDGSVAPFALETYDQVVKHADQIKAVTQAHIMPPWKADTAFSHFVDERTLSEKQIEILAAWADGGTAKGNAADLPDMPKFTDGWQLGKPDFIVKSDKPFDVPASGKDVYRAFVIPMNIPEDTYVSGVEFHAGAPTAVHHSIFFLDNSGEARKLAANSIDGEPGYATFGGVGFRATGGLGGWAPGAQPFMLDDGIGKLIQKDSDLVLQIHFHPDGMPHKDQSEVGIYLAKKPVTKRIVALIPVGTRRINIAAGDNHYTRESHFTVPLPITLVGVTPHMHLLGKEMKVTAIKPDGTVVGLVWIHDWDFRWQDQYRFAEPIALPAGTRFDLTAVYDNSAENPSNPNSPPKRVTFGEQTTDEMCFCFLQIQVNARPNPAGAALFRQMLLKMQQEQESGN
jgi:peroxiredoxin